GHQKTPRRRVRCGRPRRPLREKRPRCLAGDRTLATAPDPGPRRQPPLPAAAAATGERDRTRAARDPTRRHAPAATRRPAFRVPPGGGRVTS
ncbi:unnamed protein product, partial [Ixodes persulcatus]